MYHHHNDLTTHDNHSLGRPASFCSTLYQKSCTMGDEETKTEQDNTNASHGWHQHDASWNHNNECNNSKSSPPLTPLPPSSSINNSSSISNHLSFHPSSISSSYNRIQHDSLPSIIPYDNIKTMSSPSTTHNNNTTASTSSNNNNIMSAYNSPTYFVSPSTNGGNTSASAYPTSNTSSSHPYSSYYGSSNSSNNTTSNSNSNNHPMSYQSRHSLVARPKLTTTLWEDEGTICYQVDANGICVARRQDNDMINGTKLLNVAGMSRGKRDGILKNEKGRVVVKVGAMHLKGVWITFARAKLLAAQYKIQEILYPLFVDDPSVFLYATALHNPMSSSRINSLNGYNSSNSSRLGFNSSSTYQQWDRQLSSIHHDHNNASSYRNVGIHNNNSMNSDMYMLSSSQQQQEDYNSRSPPTYLPHSNSSYSLYGDNNSSSVSSRPRMYFTNELLDDESRQQPEIKHEQQLSDTSSPYYGHNNKPGTNALASPTPSEAGKSSSAFHLPPSRTSGEYDSTSSITSGTTATSSSTTANEQRRTSLVMSSTGASRSPRHHPYMSPGKVYTPSIMSTLQSYRSDSYSTKEDELSNTTTDMNKSW